MIYVREREGRERERRRERENKREGRKKDSVLIGIQLHVLSTYM